MVNFLVVHTLPSPTSVEKLAPIAKAVGALSNPDAKWIESWAQMDEENKVYKIYCRWEAKNRELIQKIFAKFPIPVDGIYPMAVANPKDFE